MREPTATQSADQGDGNSLFYLWRDGSLCDVHLRCSDGELVPAHRVVLAACSPFFRALFVGAGCRMREGQGEFKEVQLPLDAPPLRLLLNAIYTNDSSAGLDLGTVQPLLAAASYLVVPPVLEACCALLRRHLDTASVVSTLLLAERHSCDGLREDAMRYLQAHIMQLLESPDSASLQDLHLDTLCELLGSDVLEMASEAGVAQAGATWALADPSSTPARAGQLGTLLAVARAPLSERECHEAVLAAAAALDPVPRPECIHTVTAALAAAAQQQRQRWAAGCDPLTVPARYGTPTGLLACGGLDEGWRSLRTTEVYDALTDTWQPGTAMPAPCSFAAAAGLGGRAYVVEGAAHSPAALAFDRRSQLWTHIPKMLAPRVNMAVAAVPGAGVYVLGGRAGTGKAGIALCTVERYDPSKSVWSSAVAPMQEFRTSHGAAALGGRVYAVGGQSDRATHASVEVYDPELGQWSCVQAAMRRPRKYLSVAAVGGQVLAVGGMSEKRHRLDSVEAFDPREGRWRELPPLSVGPRSSCGAAVLHDEVYVVGGSVAGGEVSPTVECWSHAAGRWRQCAPLAAARSGLAVAPV